MVLIIFIFTVISIYKKLQIKNMISDFFDKTIYYKIDITTNLT
jgi:hypothetical protein